jgi:hypothetical protein
MKNVMIGLDAISAGASLVLLTQNERAKLEEFCALRFCAVTALSENSKAQCRSLYRILTCAYAMSHANKKSAMPKSLPCLGLRSCAALLELSTRKKACQQEKYRKRSAEKQVHIQQGLRHCAFDFGTKHSVFASPYSARTSALRFWKL